MPYETLMSEGKTLVLKAVFFALRGGEGMWDEILLKWWISHCYVSLPEDHFPNSVAFFCTLSLRKHCLRDTITPSKKKDCSIFRRVANGGGSSRWVIFKAAPQFLVIWPRIHDISHDKNPTAKRWRFFSDFPKYPHHNQNFPAPPQRDHLWIGNGTVLTQQEIDFPPRSLCQEWHSVRCLGGTDDHFPVTPSPSHPKSYSHSWWVDVSGGSKPYPPGVWMSIGLKNKNYTPRIAQFTPVKSNIAPEKWWLEDCFPIRKGYLKLQGGTSFLTLMAFSQ